jgi:hypothetical protein
LASGEQVIGTLGAQPVGQREEPVRMPQILLCRQRCGLVHDHLGLGPATARATASGSSASASTGRAPSARSVSRLDAVLVIPTTS